MEIKYSNQIPPIYDLCKRKFGASWDKGTIFTYGDTVHCKFLISDDLKVHEATHVRQQAVIGRDIWWNRYLNDATFRLEQELEAYRNQMDYIMKHYKKKEARKQYDHIIYCMANIYGDMCTKAEALKLLQWQS
jgi:hypothetical protein